MLALTVYSSHLESVLHYALFGYDVFHSYTTGNGHDVLLLTRMFKTGQPTKEQIEDLVQQTKSRNGYQGLPYGKAIYQTPAPFMREQVEPFRSLWRSPQEVQEILERSTLAQDAITAVTRGQIALDETPPLPLKTGHVALQLATGRFNGAVGMGDNRHVVKGRVVRTPVETEEEDENGEPVTTVRQVLSIEVTAIDKNGEISVLRSDGEGEVEEESKVSA